MESSKIFETNPPKKVQSGKYVSKKMTKYALMIKQMQLFLGNCFGI